MIDLFGTRPADQIVSRTVRITLGGTPYELPVRSIRANREWKERLNAKTAALVTSLDSSGDDIAAVLGVLSTQIDDMIDLLVSYDTAGVLPSREEIEEIEPDPSGEIVAAVREVWRAANPLVATAIESAASTLTPPSSPPTSTRPVPMAGSRRKSKAS